MIVLNVLGCFFEAVDQKVGYTLLNYKHWIGFIFIRHLFVSKNEFLRRQIHRGWGRESNVLAVVSSVSEVSFQYLDIPPYIYGQGGC